MLAYALGLLLGLGVVVYILFSIKRGYLLEENWRGAIKYISRQQEPFFFWVLVIFCLVIGSIVVTVCVIALAAQWSGKFL